VQGWVVLALSGWLLGRAGAMLALYIGRCVADSQHTRVLCLTLMYVHGGRVHDAGCRSNGVGNGLNAQSCAGLGLR
jgi:hypothetical protein